MSLTREAVSSHRLDTLPSALISGVRDHGARHGREYGQDLQRNEIRGWRCRLNDGRHVRVVPPMHGTLIRRCFPKSLAPTLSPGKESEEDPGRRAPGRTSAERMALDPQELEEASNPYAREATWGHTVPPKLGDMLSVGERNLRPILSHDRQAQGAPRLSGTLCQWYSAARIHTAAHSPPLVAAIGATHTKC